MPKKTTIKTIARALGVSPSTVSKALHGSKEIGYHTRERILKYAEEAGYRPHQLALSLRNRRTKMLGVIVPEVTHHFFSRVITGIEERASWDGYQVIVGISKNEREKEKKLLEKFSGGYTDGILISLAKETLRSGNYAHFYPLLDGKFPVVFFDRPIPHHPVDKVIIDDLKAGYQAVKHLIETGCRDIAVISTPPYLKVGYEREQGYFKALTEAGLPVNENRIVRIDEKKDLRRQIAPLFDNPPDGIFAVNETYAYEALRLAKRNGIRIPARLRIVAFSDGIISKIAEPPMTTVAQHGFEMGQTAAGILIDKIENRLPAKPVTKIQPTHLIIRQSTKAAVSREG